MRCVFDVQKRLDLGILGFSPAGSLATNLAVTLSLGLVDSLDVGGNLGRIVLGMAAALWVSGKG